MAYNMINMMYTLISGILIYPGNDWVNLSSYLAVVTSFIYACGAFVKNYYFWKLVKLPRILNIEE